MPALRGANATGMPLFHAAWRGALVFATVLAYIRLVDISAERSGLAIFAFADVSLQNLDTTGRGSPVN
jgi:hypothetical protein